MSENATKIKWDPTVEISGLHSSIPTQLQMAATWDVAIFVRWQ